MNRVVHIESYFSLPTDLAAEMQGFPEFVDGSGYNVRLQSLTESVAIRFNDTSDAPFLIIEGEGDGGLFDQVLGRVMYALTAHSDTVCLHRVREGLV